MTIAGYQARMARAALGVTRQELAKASGVSIGALQNFENGKRTPHDRTVRDIRQSLERHGVEFIERGVRLLQAADARMRKSGEE